MNKKFNNVIAYCKFKRLPEVDDALCMFDDCKRFKECYPDEWRKLNNIEDKYNNT